MTSVGAGLIIFVPLEITLSLEGFCVLIAPISHQILLRNHM